MAYEWDDLQKKRFARWGAEAGLPVLREYVVAGGELAIDVVLPGGLSSPPVFDFLPAGLVAVENKAPGHSITLADYLRFQAKCLLLLERRLVHEGLPPGAEPTDGVMIGSTLGRRVVRRLDVVLIEPGRWRLEAPLLTLHLIAANRLVRSVRTAPLILYYGSDRAVRRLIDEVDPRDYLDQVSRVLLQRRQVVREGLRQKGIEMSEVKIEINESIEEIGIAKVIEEVGLARVIEEIGLARVIEEVGVERVEEAIRELKRQ